MLALQYIRYYVLPTLFSAFISFSLQMWPVFDSDWKTHTFYFSSPSQRKNGYSIRKMAMPIDKAHVTFTRSLFSTFSFSGCQKLKSQFCERSVYFVPLICHTDVSQYLACMWPANAPLYCVISPLLQAHDICTLQILILILIQIHVMSSRTFALSYIRTPMHTQKHSWSNGISVFVFVRVHFWDNLISICSIHLFVC